MASSKILALEDVALRYDLHSSLGRRTDLSMETAPSGWELLLMASRSNPNLLLLDHWMPDMLGDEVLDRLRRLPHLSTTPVIMLAAGIGLDAGNRCKNLGPTVLLSQRTEHKHLMRELNRVLHLRHRRQKRVDVSLPVTVRYKGIKADGFTRDLSTQGALIEAGITPPRGASLEIIFWDRFEERTPLSATQGLVQHFRDTSSSPQFGVEFVDLAEQHTSVDSDAVEGSFHRQRGCLVAGLGLAHAHPPAGGQRGRFCCTYQIQTEIPTCLSIHCLSWLRGG